MNASIPIRSDPRKKAITINGKPHINGSNFLVVATAKIIKTDVLMDPIIPRPSSSTLFE